MALVDIFPNMDFSEVPADSTAPRTAGIMASATLPLTLCCAVYAAMHGLHADRGNMWVSRYLMATWVLLVIGDIFMIVYTFGTPHCSTVYAHIFPCFARIPCPANLAYTLSLVGSTVGCCLTCLALLQRFQFVADALSGNHWLHKLVHLFWRLAPLGCGLDTFVALVGMVYFNFEFMPSPSILPVSWWLSVVARSPIVIFIVLGGIGSICHICTIVHVRRVLLDVEYAVSGRSNDESVPSTETGSDPISSATLASGDDHAPEPLSGSTIFVSDILQSSFTKAMAAQERKDWRTVYALSLACILHAALAGAVLLGLIPQILEQPIVLQTVFLTTGIRTYLFLEFLLIRSMKSALEANRKRRAPCVMPPSQMV